MSITVCVQIKLVILNISKFIERGNIKTSPNYISMCIFTNVRLQKIASTEMTQFI